MYSVPKAVNVKHLLVNYKFMLSDIYKNVLVLKRQFNEKRNNTNLKRRRETVSKHINFVNFK